MDKAVQLPLGFAPEIMEAMGKETQLYSILTGRKRLFASDMIKEIEDIINKLDDEIEYESGRCKCCGIHPDEINDYY